jgi:hypothetical protein
MGERYDSFAWIRAHKEITKKKPPTWVTEAPSFDTKSVHSVLVGSGKDEVLQMLCYTTVNWTSTTARFYCLYVTCYCMLPLLVVYRQTGSFDVTINWRLVDSARICHQVAWKRWLIEWLMVWNSAQLQYLQQTVNIWNKSGYSKIAPVTVLGGGAWLALGSHSFITAERDGLQSPSRRNGEGKNEMKLKRRLDRTERLFS